MSLTPVSRQLLLLLDNAVLLLARTGLSADFIRFGVVGTLGFCWDTATVYATKNHFGLYVAGTLGFFVAATVNWAFNRWWTFRHRAHIAAHVQWLKFLPRQCHRLYFQPRHLLCPGRGQRALPRGAGAGDRRGLRRRAGVQLFSFEKISF